MINLAVFASTKGTDLQAVIDGYVLSSAKPENDLRKKLGAMDTERLFAYLYRLNPEIAEELNESDRKNKRRLVRRIEMIKSGEEGGMIKGEKRYDALILGLRPEKEKMEKRIYKRLIERLEEENMIGEVKRLRKQGVSWKRLERFGLEYRFIALYLQKKINHDEMVEQLFIAIRQFAKRQLTWFRRWEEQGERIDWVTSKSEAVKSVKGFVKK